MSNKMKIPGGSGDPPRRKAKLEAATVMPLEVVKKLEPDEARKELLVVLLQHALAGDVRAAKLYLDYSFRENVEEQTGLTLEEAITLSRSQSESLNDHHD